MATYEDAPEVELLALEVIPPYHPHLEKARLRYLYTDKKMRSGGLVVLGKAKKAADLVKHFGDVDFVIVISKEQWALLTDFQRKALVDHELCHCRLTVTTGGEHRWWIRGHDVEEFTEIIERYGLWNRSVEQLVRAGAQMPLPVGPAHGVPEEVAGGPGAGVSGGSGLGPAGDAGPGPGGAAPASA